MKKPVLLRKRYIPEEIVDISNDILIHRDEELLVTKWTAIKPRLDIQGGISYTFLKEGFKLGKFYNPKGDFLYWYCDIIDVLYDEAKDTYTLDDLLIDIKLLPDGTIKVLDADELAEALDRKLVTPEQVSRALKKFDHVLSMIYSGNFPPVVCNKFSYICNTEGGFNEAG
jgi:Uncharacterized conserved protein